MLAQVTDPIVLTNGRVCLDEVWPGALPAQNFKFVGSKRVQFASEAAFRESMNENPALNVFQCVTDMVKLPEGDLDVRFDVSLVIQDELRQGMSRSDRPRHFRWVCHEP